MTSATIVRRLSATGDMTFGNGLANYASGKEACRQNVSTRLALFLGEWFLDTSAGVPYLQDIFVKPSDLLNVEAVLKLQILGTADVTEITEFDISLNHVNRACTVNTSVLTTFDPVPVSVSVTVGGL